MDSMALGGSINGNIVEQSIEHIGLADSNEENPIKLTTRFNSSMLIEHAGNNYILNIGYLIDKQKELYNKR